MWALKILYKKYKSVKHRIWTSNKKQSQKVSENSKLMHKPTWDWFKKEKTLNHRC